MSSPIDIKQFISQETLSASLPSPNVMPSSRWERDEYDTFPHSYPASFQKLYKESGGNRSFNYARYRKCGYVIASLEAEVFINRGAEVLVPDSLYILKRNYVKESPAGETCAVIGITKKYVKEIMDSESHLYSILKSCDQLKDVPGISTLSPYRLNALKYLLKYLYFIYDRELILFNIEPKGEDGHEHKYPSANICIPGGGMELQDGQCFERCAIREFYEETGFSIVKASNNSTLITKQKVTFPDRQCMYFIYRIKST